MILGTLPGTPPPDLLHDPVFQFVANAVIAILAVVITSILSIWIYRRQQSKRSLGYRIISDAPVISIKKAVANRVKVEFDGRPVTEVTLAVIQVVNTGNTAIKKDDYENSLSFVFKGREVIGSEVVETKPEDLIDEPTRKSFVPTPATPQDHLEFPKFLLNPKQSVTLSILLDGPRNEVNSKGRIIDGEIKKLGDERNTSVRLLMILTFVGLAATGIFFVSLFEGIAAGVTIAIGVITASALLIGTVLTLGQLLLLLPFDRLGNRH